MRDMLCIDFGNSFTKVAVRKGTENPSALLSDAGVTTDDLLHSCVPTVAAQLGGNQWFYGLEVETFQEGVEGLVVHRNWKPQFFLSPIHQLIPGITGATTGAPRRRGRPKKVAPPIDYDGIGVGYFRWLRNYWDAPCIMVTGKPCSQIPVRVTLPSFGAQSGAELKLKNILAEAGWTFDDSFPVLPEPLANVIGALSNGANHRHPKVNQADYGQMFRETGLFQRMRQAVLADGAKVAWTLIVDVGGFTTDFAMLGIDLTLLSAELAGEIDGKPGLKHYSKALGIADLDRRVRGVIPAAKQGAFDEILAKPGTRRLEGFHENVYGRTTRQVLKRGVVAGETEAERTAIRHVIAEFAGEVADGTEEFLNYHNYDRIDDVILTGGGTMIPEIRDTLMTRLKYYGYRVAHCHIPTGEDAKPPFRRLSRQLPRGGTAIGGTSLYFDYALER